MIGNTGTGDTATDNDDAGMGRKRSTHNTASRKVWFESLLYDTLTDCFFSPQRFYDLLQCDWEFKDVNTNGIGDGIGNGCGYWRVDRFTDTIGAERAKAAARFKDDGLDLGNVLEGRGQVFPE